jgi:NAD(P)-dependent dehydrogenase (short-subunit alcohol dehydrogenase family)
VSSGIGDPLRVVTIDFLGTRHFTEALIPSMPSGSAIASVSSLAASEYRANAAVTAGLLDTATMAEGVEWCGRNPQPVKDGGGYRLAKEALILYGMANVTVLGAKGIRINCTAPGVTDTPILDQLRSAYGQEFLDSFKTPIGRVAGPDEQASVLVFLNSNAARYITGQVIWVDGGSVAERVIGDVADERRKVEHGQLE